LPSVTKFKAPRCEAAEIALAEKTTEEDVAAELNVIVSGNAAPPSTVVEPELKPTVMADGGFDVLEKMRRSVARKAFGADVVLPEGRFSKINVAIHILPFSQRTMDGCRIFVIAGFAPRRLIYQNSAGIKAILGMCNPF